jgi:hypothetical protein
MGLPPDGILRLPRTRHRATSGHPGPLIRQAHGTKRATPSGPAQDARIVAAVVGQDRRSSVLRRLGVPTGRDAEVAQLLDGCRFSSSLIHQLFQPFVIEAEVVADLVLHGIFDRLLEVVPGAAHGL